MSDVVGKDVMSKEETTTVFIFAGEDVLSWVVAGGKFLTWIPRLRFDAFCRYYMHLRVPRARMPHLHAVPNPRLPLTTITAPTEGASMNR